MDCAVNVNRAGVDRSTLTRPTGTLSQRAREFAAALHDAAWQRGRSSVATPARASSDPNNPFQDFSVSAFHPSTVTAPIYPGAGSRSITSHSGLPDPIPTTTRTRPDGEFNRPRIDHEPGADRLQHRLFPGIEVDNGVRSILLTIIASERRSVRPTVRARVTGRN